MRDKSYVRLKMRKNAIFTKMTNFKWLYLQNYATKFDLADGILKNFKKAFKSRSLNVFNIKFGFLAYFLVQPTFEGTVLRLSSWEK